jgi:asparagine synthase (glutamine-hydrolysing)
MPSAEIGLGHRRLAVLDLSPLAHQPMHDPETGNWIVYNGEIYNFRELRAELERSGVSFISASDTEVVLKAYRVWGAKCLARLNGMFAFAIWDKAEGKLFLARDPFGIKPLYYYADERHFLFASEVRTLLATGMVPRKLDAAGLLNYLRFGSVYDPDTLIAGVRAVGAGCSLMWQNNVWQSNGSRNNSIAQSKVWDLHDTAACEKSEHSRPVATPASIRETLFSAVRSQMVSDVPVGVFLSGGIDSSALVAILSQGQDLSQKEKISTFSLVFEENDFSEAEYSRTIAQKFRTDHHEIHISQRDALDSLRAAIAAMDQPTMDGVNTYLVSLQARTAGLKVALSGLGSDELFGGYGSFRIIPRLQQFYRLWHHVPDFARRSAGSSVGFLSPRSDKNRKLEALISENGRLLHSWFLSRMLFTPAMREQLFSAADAASHARADAALQQELDQSRHLDPINQVSYLEARCYMRNTLLRDSDGMSMAHGLELRVPFLDRDLAHRIFSLPGKCKLGTSPKPLLVNALNGALPENIVRRPKRGFTLPFERWLRDELREPLQESLSGNGAGPLASLLNARAVSEVWSDFLSGKTSWSRPWALHVLDRWCAQNL